MRIGIGYDVHKLVEDRDLILGGTLVPYKKGLMGHSDADVLIHAIMDALLGAMGKGDIGVYFPDTDDTYKGISSIKLLEEVNKIIVQDGYSISNIDSVIVCQKPKLREFIPKMEENIAECLNIDASRVNIKATTEEYLGFTGRLEGISAKAVCLLEEN